MFCPKCGSLIMPKKDGKKTVMKCSCGYSKTGDGDTKIQEKVKDGDTVDVVDKEETMHPLVPAECPRCNHGMAYFWMIQTRASDEPETKFYKCEKCKHTWRDYS